MTVVVAFIGWLGGAFVIGFFVAWWLRGRERYQMVRFGSNCKYIYCVRLDEQEVWYGCQTREELHSYIDPTIHVGIKGEE